MGNAVLKMRGGNLITYNQNNSWLIACERFFVLCFVLFLSLNSSSAYDLPENFDNVEVIGGLSDPDGMAFSPDGRLFISERISGRLLVSNYVQGTDSWSAPTVFHTFTVPTIVRRSAGLRDIAFDPDFLNNGLIYAFYMHNSDLQNRVVRIKENVTPGTSDSSFGTAGEEILIMLPFNDSQASGSHNGGAIEFGKASDTSLTEELFISTGDGWTGDFEGDDVQSLSTFTGKIFRINSDGTIPADNPFCIPGSAPFCTTAGNDIGSIFALGLRNPYSMSKNPDTGRLYVNDAQGTNKAQIYLVESGANYGFDAGSVITIGTETGVWANASGDGGELITGGAWMPSAGVIGGSFPTIYNGVYFTALWGGNSETTGQISYVQSTSDNSVTSFETGIGEIGANGINVKPVTTRIGPEGDLYYLLTTYTTNSGAVRRVRFTNQETVETPKFINPVSGLELPGGLFENAIDVAITTETVGANIYYTIDLTSPSIASLPYTPGQSINIAADTVLKARAFKQDFNDSAIKSEIYLIGARPPNLPPVVDAGDDKTVFVGENVTLDGSGTTDPDGNDDFLTGELWTKISGPDVTIIDATEENASFIPPEPGSYVFQLEVSDGLDVGMDTVTMTAVRSPRVSGNENNLQALYLFDTGSGNTVFDQSGTTTKNDLTIQDANTLDWIENGGIVSTGNARISGADNGNKIYNACTSSNAITMETWITPANTSPTGLQPKRILSFSRNTTNRNFTLGQDGDSYDTRLRTTATDANGVPSLTVQASTASTELTHVVYTRNSSGAASFYINGVPQDPGTVGGNLSSWDNGNDYQITLFNELSDDRNWLGSMFLAAIYCDALDATEVLMNFSAGLPPFETIDDTDMDGVFDPFDNCIDDINPGQEDLDGDGDGDACDTDIDNDGLGFPEDQFPTDVMRCRDVDGDMCDDCAVGVDGFGPLADFDIENDGLNTDANLPGGDTLCDFGDPDDDADGILDDEDDCPLFSNPGDAACPDASICFPVRGANNQVSMVCL